MIRIILGLVIDRSVAPLAQYQVGNTPSPVVVIAVEHTNKTPYEVTRAALSCCAAAQTRHLGRNSDFALQQAPEGTGFGARNIFRRRRKNVLAPV